MSKYAISFQVSNQCLNIERKDTRALVRGSKSAEALIRPYRPVGCVLKAFKVRAQEIATHQSQLRGGYTLTWMVGIAGHR